LHGGEGGLEDVVGVYVAGAPHAYAEAEGGFPEEGSQVGALSGAQALTVTQEGMGKVRRQDEGYGDDRPS